MADITIEVDDLVKEKWYNATPDDILNKYALS
jgi:hypothetical protein